MLVLCMTRIVALDSKGGISSNGCFASQVTVKLHFTFVVVLIRSTFCVYDSYSSVLYACTQVKTGQMDYLLKTASNPRFIGRTKCLKTNVFLDRARYVSALAAIVGFVKEQRPANEHLRSAFHSATKAQLTSFKNIYQLRLILQRLIALVGLDCQRWCLHGGCHRYEMLIILSCIMQVTN